MTRSRSPIALPLAIAAVIAVGALAPSLFLGRIPAQTDWIYRVQPWRIDPRPPVYNESGGDSYLQFLPDRLAAVRELREGRFPLWNPHVSGGVPFLGMQTADPLDPAILLFLLLPPGPALGIHYALLLFLAGAGMILYLRHLGVRSPPALAVGAAAFALNPYFISWLELRVFTAALAGAPLALWGMERALAGIDRRRSGAVLALCVGYAFLAGTLQTSALLLLVLGVRALWLAVASGREGVPVSRGLLWSAGALAAGAGIGILSLAAGIEVLSRSTRLGGGGGYYAASNYLDWRVLGLWFNPEAYGWTDAIGPATFPAYGKTFASSSGWGAVGVVPLWLAAAAGRDLRRRGTGFWLGLGLAVLAFLMLQATPLHRALLAVWPSMDDVDLLRGLFPVNLAGAILAARGAERLDREGPGRSAGAALAGVLVAGTLLIALGRSGLAVPRSLLASLAPLVLLAAATGAILLAPAGNRRRVWLLCGLVVLELGFLHFRTNTFAPPETNYPETGGIAAFQSVQGPPDYPRLLVAGHYGVLPPNVPSVFGLNDVRGYTNMPNARYRFLLESAEGKPMRNQPVLDNVGSPIYRLLGAAQIFCDPATDLPNFRPLDLGKKIGFFRRMDALPRAFLVHRAVRVPGEEEMRAALADPGFDPAAEVFLGPEAPLPPTASPRGEERVEIASLESTRISIRVHATAPGVLVVADPYFPGWTARVDGRETPILPADHGVRGVAVGAGDHEVVMRYRPRWLAPGTAVMAVSVLGCLVALGIPPRRPVAPRRRKG